VVLRANETKLLLKKLKQTKETKRNETKTQYTIHKTQYKNQPTPHKMTFVVGFMSLSENVEVLEKSSRTQKHKHTFLRPHSLNSICLCPSLRCFCKRISLGNPQSFLLLVRLIENDFEFYMNT